MRITPCRRRTRRRTRGAFTLVELLVVIGIIGVLTSFLLPALNGARRQAKAVRELAALKQTMTAYTMYANEKDLEQVMLRIYAREEFRNRYRHVHLRDDAAYYADRPSRRTINVA